MAEEPQEGGVLTTKKKGGRDKRSRTRIDEPDVQRKNLQQTVKMGNRCQG